LMWLSLIFYGVKVADNADTALSLNNTAALRGISAIEIMLGHIGIVTGNVIQFPNRKAGILFVGIFFMLSGYGLAYGYANKAGYLQHFFKKRFLKILIPTVLVIIASAIYYRNISIEMVLESGARWYITELFVLYIIFYVSYRFIGEKGIIVITVVTAVFVVLAYFMGLSNPWYGSTFCFPLGMAYYNFKKDTVTLKTKRRVFYVSLLLLGMLSAIAGFFVLDGSFVGNVLCRSLASVSFCLAVILVLEKIRIGNMFVEYLSLISFEIYLIHGIVIDYCSSAFIFKDNVFGFTILVTIITLTLAFTFNWICRFILRILIN